MVVARRTPPPLAGATILKPPCSLSGAMANFVSASSGAKRSKYLCFCRLARPRTSLAWSRRSSFVRRTHFTNASMMRASYLRSMHAEQPLVLRRLAGALAQLLGRDAVRLALADRSFRFSAALSSR